jgi:hypothetical protein
MAVTIQPNQIQNLQQIEAAVAGPDGANRLFIINGQFDAILSVGAPGGGVSATEKEIFTVLVGPVFTRRQFVRANATASITKNAFSSSGASAGSYSSVAWQILDMDADWDDESGQVELTIEAQVSCSGAGQLSGINGFAFAVTILAATAA